MGTCACNELTVRIGEVLYPAGRQVVTFQFDRRLQHRGTDFAVYANTGYTEDSRDTELLKSILERLFRDSVPVEQTYVKPFALVVHANSTISVERLNDIVVNAACEVGYVVDYDEV